MAGYACVLEAYEELLISGDTRNRGSRRVGSEPMCGLLICMQLMYVSQRANDVGYGYMEQNSSHIMSKMLLVIGASPL